jgi:hypothetical protein
LIWQVVEDLMSIGLPMPNPASSSSASSVPHSVAPVPDIGHLCPELLRLSFNAAQANHKLLTDAARDQTIPGTTPNIGLVKYVIDGGIVVSYMQWRLRGNHLEAQPIYADAKNRIKYSVHFSIPYRRQANYQSLQALHPDLGVQVSRVFRNDIPPDFVTLKQLWETVFRNSDPSHDAQGACLDECEVCHSLAGLNMGLLSTCALCLHTYHDQCCRTSLLPHFDPLLHQIRGDSLPTEFQHDAVLCSVCQQVARTIDPLN